MQIYLLQRNKANENFAEEKNIYVTNIDLIVNYWKFHPKR